MTVFYHLAPFVRPSKVTIVDMNRFSMLRAVIALLAVSLLAASCSANSVTETETARPQPSEPIELLEDSIPADSAPVSTPPEISEETSNKADGLPAGIKYSDRCWSDANNKGTYEITWPTFNAPELSGLQTILDEQAIIALEQFNQWEGENNSLSFTSEIEFANQRLISVRSNTFYMAATAAHPQDMQTALLWDVQQEQIIEPFNPDPASTAKMFVDEEHFLSFYTTMSDVPAAKFGFDSYDAFNRHSPMAAVVATSEGLVASWDRSGAVPSFETFLPWNEISGVNELLTANADKQQVKESSRSCVSALSEEAK